MTVSPRRNPMQRKNGQPPRAAPNDALGALIDRVRGSSPPTPFWASGPAKPPPLSGQQQMAVKLMQDAAVFVKFGQFAAALPLVTEAARLWPTNADILYQAGCIQMETGDNPGAIAKLDAALSLRPKWADAWNNKSAALARMGRHDEALEAAHKAIEIAPNVGAYANLCAAYSGMGEHEKAIGYGEKAVNLSEGQDPMCLINLGVAKRATWDLEEAAGCEIRAIDLMEKQPQKHRPNYMAYANLGAIRNLQGRNHEAMAVTQRAAEIAPQNSTLQSNMIMFSDLLPETTLIEALHRRRHWAYSYEAPLRKLWRQHKNDRDPDRKLRVGYVGADFRQHSAAHIHGAVVRAHDPEQIAVYIYAGNRGADEVTEKIQESKAIAEWVYTGNMNDYQLAERIYSDQIDILVDCASFTSGGRLIAFACKPAPIQATAWGYANGTGLDSMDVFLADEVIVPPELEWGYTETVIKMSSLLCFDPFLELPPPGPPPIQRNGYVTFGSYNRVEKISEPILRLWCEVMKQIPDSRIILKFGGLQGETASRLKHDFRQWGINDDRVECRGHTPREEHLRQYGDVDIMLDSWPHVGGITTLEAAMMGVPCVTLLGDRAPSRVSASLLTTLGMTDWIARRPEEYIEIAKAKAAEDLSGLRAGLPGRIQQSVLGDVPRYTRELETVYRQLWRSWVGHVAPPTGELP